MGTTFVTLRRDSSGKGLGFWMNDGMLEYWLRLLALHLPEPTDEGQYGATIKIRNQLLASRGWCMGCVPHGMEDACSTEEGREVVRMAIDSLLEALQQDEAPLDAPTLNLLGVDGDQTRHLERKFLRDIGRAFLDLLDGRIACTSSCTRLMPGTIVPYEPQHDEPCRGAQRLE